MTAIFKNSTYDGYIQKIAHVTAIFKNSTYDGYIQK